MIYSNRRIKPYQSLKVNRLPSNQILADVKHFTRQINISAAMAAKSILTPPSRSQP